MGVNIKDVMARIEAQKAAKLGKAAGAEFNVVETITKIDNLIIPVSDAQKTTYLTLCRDKGQDVNTSYSKWDGRRNGQMDKEIKRLLLLPTVKRPNEQQIELVKTICERNDWEIPDYSQKTGGREGTMSQLIQELINLEKDVQRNHPLTDNQYQIILEMYYCPDIDFSDLHEDLGLKYVIIDGKKFWSRPDEELLTKLEDFVTYQEASNFIYKYNSQFYKWKTTRLSDAQINRIQHLQEKNGMKPMEDYQLMSMDRNQANEYINRLDYVWKDRELVKFQCEPFYADDNRGAKTVEQALDKDFIARGNLIHSIYAMMGMRASEESFIEEDCDMDVLRDACSVAKEICGTQPVYDLLIEVYSQAEVCDILNINIDENIEETEEIPF